MAQSRFNNENDLLAHSRISKNMDDEQRKCHFLTAGNDLKQAEYDKAYSDF